MEEPERDSLESPSCIFCRETSGGFESEEHMFPESLIGDAAVLPRGYVCDRCNHGRLGDVDKFLINFGPFALGRVVFGPLTKKGKFPRAEIGDLIIEKTRPGHVELRRRDGSAPFQKLERCADGEWQVEFSAGGKPNWRRVARGIAKIALEFVAFHKGHEYACHPDFDAARRFILEGAAHRSYLCVRTRGAKMKQGASVAGWAGELIEIVIFGVHTWVSLREAETTPLVDEAQLLEHGIMAVPLWEELPAVGAVEA